tara:strand:- start:145583 stop:146101 length:519 start_codon:yes stop_codon:yes gene_type:complete
MKTIKIFSSILAIVLLATSVSAQEFVVPQKYSLEKTADYAPYENDVIACATWLETAPVKGEKKKLKAANKFLMQWLTGSPSVTIEINEKIVNFSEVNPELITVFMAGWAKYALENKVSYNEVLANIAGIKSVVKSYNTNLNKGMKQDEAIEKYKELIEHKQITKWVNHMLYN